MLQRESVKELWSNSQAPRSREESLYTEAERGCKPEKVVQLAVRRMLPKNRLGRRMLKKLKVYRGPDHEHQAQRPERIDLS